ncbi:MAG TPA: serine protease [Candidatus Acidoferrum sp.]|nr:serine protease [Candidatus Acidoferrum sp.]
MDKIVISPTELSEVGEDPGQAARVEPKLPPAIPWWGRLLLALLTPFLPLLCLVTIILRVAFRGQPPRTRHAWTAYLSTLLIISGFLTSMALVIAVSLGPVAPSFISPGLSDLDERTDYPALPAQKPLTGVDASQELKSLVAVISPASRSWFGKREMLSTSFGAGMLLQANASGYLFATARHVIGTDNWNIAKGPRAMIALASGIWTGADVIAKHKNLDLALIWLPRHSGEAEFVQPIAEPKEGENIFVIGHPEGLRFTLSTGLISRMDNTVLQITAPISPGNSGGPVYDQMGNLVGVVSSTLDKSIQPNAEEINFAVTAGALLRQEGWEFAKGGRDRFLVFLHASQRSGAEDKASNRRSRLLPADSFHLLPWLRTDGHN